MTAREGGVIRDKDHVHNAHEHTAGYPCMCAVCKAIMDALRAVSLLERLAQRTREGVER